MTEVDSEMNKMGIESRIYSLDFNPKPALLSNIALSRLLAVRALKNGFDSLIFHQGHAASTWLRKARIVCYFHEVNYDNMAGDGVAHRLYKNLLAAIEHQLTQVVCNSEYVASRLRVLIPEANIRVVYPGVRQPTHNEKNPSRQDFCYFHSRIHPRKNQSFLVKVFEKLPYKLLLTGGTWDRRFRNYQTNLMREISRFSTIEIATNISDEQYHDFLSESIIFCFPARFEPFGLTLLEAMAYGKPIVALESGSVPEVLGTAGMTCKPELEEWRNTIKQLVLDSDLRSTLSKKSFARAKGFSWEKTAKDLVATIEASG